MGRSLRPWVVVALAATTLLVAEGGAQASGAAPQEGRQGPPGGRGRFGGARGPAVPTAPDRSVDPFPTPLPATEGAITVGYVEFASIPDAGTAAPRINLLVDEPGTRRLFVNTMPGMLYAVSYDGTSVTPYLDVNDPTWAVPVQANNSERLGRVEVNRPKRRDGQEGAADRQDSLEARGRRAIPAVVLEE